MHLRLARLLVLLLSFLALPAPLSASSQCRQQFKYLTCTNPAQPTFWIGMHLSGQCEQTQLLQIVTGATPQLLTHDLKRDLILQNLAPLGDMLEPLPTQTLHANATGAWSIPKSKGAFTKPAPDATLERKFSNHIAQGGSNGATFHADPEHKEIQSPQFQHLQADLVYAWPGGLYLNYDIAQAYLLERENLLLIFTHQPLTAVGNDSMHGILVFSLHLSRAIDTTAAEDTIECLASEIVGPTGKIGASSFEQKHEGQNRTRCAKLPAASKKQR